MRCSKSDGNNSRTAFYRRDILYASAERHLCQIMRRNKVQVRQIRRPFIFKGSLDGNLID